ncbi:uncharacterized protein LOC119368106 [Triticum dicoccoides]|uniref:uncharacterized protein LOC119368106 n=1 Tax=Triticum dicoccoides TaxID=85692 RepID=UPI00188E4B80|nr:uncharacterized protein LOC119368106 [Triticum dicoccoides]
MEAGAGPPKPAATAKVASSSSSFSSVAATAASLVAVGLGGAALLVWWALAFHPAHARLWMVPAGLVLLGTPVLAWLSLFASGPCRCGRRPVEAPPAPGAHAGA